MPADISLFPLLSPPQGDHKAGEIQGQTRQHARLINLLGVRQLIIGVNKMDSDTAGYKQERYNEIRDEMKHMLARVGWKVRARARAAALLRLAGARAAFDAVLCTQAERHAPLPSHAQKLRSQAFATDSGRPPLLSPLTPPPPSPTSSRSPSPSCPSRAGWATT